MKVYLRVRPAVDEESTEVLEFDADDFHVVRYQAGQRKVTKTKEESFTFDRIFPPSAPQTLVYEDAAKPVVTAVFGGVDGTIFAYG